MGSQTKILACQALVSEKSRIVLLQNKWVNCLSMTMHCFIRCSSTVQPYYKRSPSFSYHEFLCCSLTAWVAVRTQVPTGQTSAPFTHYVVSLTVVFMQQHSRSG